MRAAANDTVLPVDPSISPEQALWRAVLLRACQDATNAGTKGRHAADRAAARAWLIEAGADFRLVADMAGYDGEALREVLEPRIAEWVAEAAPPQDPLVVVKRGRGRPRKDRS